MDLEEQGGVDPVIQRTCSECGAKLTEQEITGSRARYARASSSATHSMCGVCGNMSTGRTVHSS